MTPLPSVHRRAAVSLSEHCERRISLQKKSRLGPTEFPAADISNGGAMVFRFAPTKTQLFCIQHLQKSKGQLSYNQHFQNMRLKAS